MSEVLRLKYSPTKGLVPALAELMTGELAINSYDGLLYTKISDAGVDSITCITDFSHFVNLPTTLQGYGIVDAQPLSNGLSTIDALTGNLFGLLASTSNGWILDQNQYLTNNLPIVISGDATGVGTTAITLTLSPTGVSSGTYGSGGMIPVITISEDGRITSAVTQAVTHNPITLQGDVIASGVDLLTTTLSVTGVTAGQYGDNLHIPQITVDTKGRITNVNTVPVSANLTSMDLSNSIIENSTIRNSSLSNVIFSGSTTGVTVALSDNSTNLATTEFVKNQGYLTSNQNITFTGDATGSGSTNVQLTLGNSGVAPGTYETSGAVIIPLTINAKGLVTGTGLPVPIAPPFSAIINKPTTLAGYGITDAASTASLQLGVPNGVATLDGGGVLISTQIPIFNGDVTSVGSSNTLTLAIVNGTPGTFGSAGAIPTITVNDKGLITAISSTPVTIPTGGGGSGINWIPETTSFTADTGNGYSLTLSAPITVTLPASPTAGTSVILLDYSRNSSTYHITVLGNGNNIEGSSSNFVIDVNGINVTLTYIGVGGWILTDTGNIISGTGANQDTDDNTFATIASPAFTGTPTAPTAANGTNNNQIATTAFVQANAVIGSSSNVASVPVGTIIPYTGTTAPAGFLLCPTVATNISRTTYSYLFAVLGTTWGVGDGSTTFGMPYFPAGYTTVTGTLGASTTGSVISHTHNSPTTNGVAMTPGREVGVQSGTGYDYSDAYGAVPTSATGGAANYAAGVQVNYIIAYLPNNGIAASLNNYAPLASPTLTGIPTVPTPAASDISSTIANTAFVNSLFTSHSLGSTYGSSGYQKLPGGLIIQWGQYTNTIASQTFNFPIAFPTSCLCIIATDTGGGAHAIGLYANSNNTFVAWSTAYTTIFNMIAIGV